MSYTGRHTRLAKRQTDYETEDQHNDMYTHIQTGRQADEQTDSGETERQGEAWIQTAKLERQATNRTRYIHTYRLTDRHASLMQTASGGELLYLVLCCLFPHPLLCSRRFPSPALVLLMRALRLLRCVVLRWFGAA